jgi:hypothetical protein
VPSASKPGRCRWFVQLLGDDVAKLRKLGRVCRSGEADDRTPFPWVELTTPACSQAEFQASLAQAGIPVRKVMPVEPKQGATLARQTELPGAFE